MMLRSLKEGNIDRAKRFGLMDCIECGCCAFVCPSRIKIVQRIRLGKGIARMKMVQEKNKTENKTEGTVKK